MEGARSGRPAEFVNPKTQAAGENAGRLCLSAKRIRNANTIAARLLNGKESGAILGWRPGGAVPIWLDYLGLGVAGAAGMSAGADDFRLVGNPFTMGAAVLRLIASHAATGGICTLLGASHGPPLPVRAGDSGACPDYGGMPDGFRK